MKNQRSRAFLSLRSVAIFTLCGFFGTTAAQAMEPKDMIGKEVYTLTNLRPDMQNLRLYSTNYLQPGLIKVCTKVRVDKVKKKKMIFTVVDSGTEYQYLFHRKSTPEGFNENIKKYFGPECPQAQLDQLSEVDKEGVKRGRTLEGMTQAGVILAVGYPPEHITPDREYDEWVYWMNKFVSRRLIFDENGIVTDPLPAR